MILLYLVWALLRNISLFINSTNSLINVLLYCQVLDKIILMNKELQYYLQENFALPGTVLEMQDAENFLVEKMNELIKTNFNYVIQLLYRIDVNENKLKQVLKCNPTEDAGKIIAQLIIERQQQKMISRNSFKKINEEINEEDKW